VAVSLAVSDAGHSQAQLHVGGELVAASTLLTPVPPNPTQVLLVGMSCAGLPTCGTCLALPGCHWCPGASLCGSAPANSSGSGNSSKQCSGCHSQLAQCGAPSSGDGGVLVRNVGFQGTVDELAQHATPLPDSLLRRLARFRAPLLSRVEAQVGSSVSTSVSTPWVAVESAGSSPVLPSSTEAAATTGEVGGGGMSWPLPFPPVNAALQLPFVNDTMLGYSPASTPVVHSVWPPRGNKGDVLTLRGSGFSPSPHHIYNQVRLGAVPCTVVAASVFHIRCVVDATLLGPVAVAVTVRSTPGAAVASQAAAETPASALGAAFNVPPAVWAASLNLSAVGAAAVRLGLSFHFVPTLSAVSPSSGSVLGGTLLCLHGTGLMAAALALSVAVGGAPCVITHVAEGTILCRSPPQERGGAAQVDVCLHMSTPTLSASPSCMRGGFQYAHSLTPTVGSVMQQPAFTGGGGCC
jgi:hypothetical protein